ncbi:translation elongation factor Ts [Roseivirga sp. BDSF3-8]|uniref:translation elongation factor Ts n=1 Tax=Roseivirga sp. BDSF3-8 TaxID=3241598 RepID=UPI003531E932
MAITAKEVNKLRQMTGAGMMDCKKALTEAEGDFDKAIELLRKKGQKVSESRSDRETSEGAVFVRTSDDNTEAVLVALSCETDFVGKNEEFQSLGKEILDKAYAEKPATVEELKGLSLGEQTVESKVVEMIGKIGEKIEIGAYERINGETVVSYIHAGSKLGVLVELAGGTGEAVEQAGRDVAMQIAAMKPVAVSADDVSDDIKERELKLGREQAKEEGKPDNIIEKIAEGKLNKFYKDNTLLSQPYVKDSSMSVQKYLDSVNKGLTVKSFKRISVAD